MGIVRVQGVNLSNEADGIYFLNGTTPVPIDRLLNKITKRHLTLAAMVADQDLLEGDIVLLLGRFAVDDGGGNIYQIVANNTGTTTLGDYILITGSATNLQAHGLFSEDVSVRQFGASPSATALDNVTAMQACIDYCFLSKRIVNINSGAYNINAALVLPFFMNIRGAGKSTGTGEHNFSSVNTQINQTAAFPVFTTSTGTILQDFIGEITLSDMTLQGGTNVSQIGTHGIFCTSSANLICERVRATWFVSDCFHIIGSLQATLRDCEARYSKTGYGCRLQFGTFGTETANANASKIIGGMYGQNNLGGIYVGNSMLGLEISSRFESNGSFFPGAGLGVYISLDAKQVSINNSYFEDNETHIVVGDESFSSNTQIPSNITIRENLFFGVNSTDLIRINSGADVVIEDNYGGENNSPVIRVNRLGNNPIIRNNGGHFNVLDNSDVVVPFGHWTGTNDITQQDLTQSEWTFTNSTVAKVAGVPPVTSKEIFRVTETVAGLSAANYTDVRASFDMVTHKTIGCWVKSVDQTIHQFYFQINTLSPLTAFSSTNDTRTGGLQWRWISIGRNVPSSFGGDFKIALVSITGSFDICDFRIMPGIIYDPFYPSRLFGTQSITIVSGIATMLIFTPIVVIDTESSAATDDLDTLTFADAQDGDIVTIVAANTARTVVVKDATGNIQISGDFSLNNTQDTIRLIRSGTDWLQISSSNNSA